MANPTTNGGGKVRLTQHLLHGLPLDIVAYTIWDREVPGFGVRVMPSGRKSFVLKYTIHGRQRWITLGRFGDLTLQEARTLALARRGEVARGKDPALAARADRTAPIIKGLIEEFIEKHVVPKTKDSTAKGYIRHLRNVIEPRLGTLPLTAITPAVVTKFHGELEDTPRQANQAVAILRKMLKCAKKFGHPAPATDPFEEFEKYPETERDRYLSPEEITALGAALHEAETNETVPAPALAALRLLILTGARLSEILELQWTQVDLRRNVLTYTADQHKTGRKTGTKRLPLNPPAIVILKGLPKVTGNPYVIQGDKPGAHFVGLQKVWERVRVSVSEMEADLVARKKKRPEDAVNIEDVRIHDLRHTFASVGVSEGLSLPLVGSLLGHTQPSMTNRYAHLADDPKAKASERIARVIARGLSGKKKRA